MMLCATTLMVYTVPLCSPLSTVLVAVAGSCSGAEPLLGTAVTVYPVTGGLLSWSVGGVHVTVMDEPVVARAVTSPGAGGAGCRERAISFRSSQRTRRENQLGWTEIDSYRLLLFNWYCRHQLGEIL